MNRIGVSSSVKPSKVNNREETPKHGNERGVKTALRQQAEAGVLKVIESLHTLKEGDLKELEQQVMATLFAVGRGWMESILSEGAADERAPGQRRGTCGHPQQLEGYRPK